MFPEWTWIIGFLIGAAVGSFINVIVYRLPRGLSSWRPAYSFCPSCKSRLTAIDLVPILSWILLRGRCRHCKERVSPRYLVVEAITGTLWAAIWHIHLSGPFTTGDPVRAVAYMLFTGALVAAIFTDLAHYIIPDQVNAFMLFVGLGENLALANQGRPEAWSGPLPASVAGALTGIGVLWGIAFLGRVLFRKDAMGHGDIKMARGIGAVLFPFLALASFGIAVVLGAVGGLLIVLLRATGKVKDPEEGPGDLPIPGNPDFSIRPGGTPEEDEAPESIGSLVWCGLGYVLCIDVIGLFVPKLYELWFGENPYSVEELEDEPQVELTMIPFGPYLAAGAIAAVVFEGPLRSAIDAYVRNLEGGP
ncbi:MAG: prepilin peptidase [Fimbriimonadaceae bacterium]|nr:prepilin peptidase [Fimbriimonadaceae bacterium]QYK55867.1 MAG: prepilin peptidase [Fimbriimonadaceae bacterium]